MTIFPPNDMWYEKWGQNGNFPKKNLSVLFQLKKKKKLFELMIFSKKIYKITFNTSSPTVVILIDTYLIFYVDFQRLCALIK